MSQFGHFATQASGIAYQSPDQFVKKLAGIVRDLARECDRLEKLAEEAKEEARRANEASEKQFPGNSN